MLDGGSRNQHRARMRAAQSPSSIRLRSKRWRMRGDGEMPLSCSFGGVEGSQKSKRVKIPSRGSGPQCIRVKAPLRLVQPGWRGELLLGDKQNRV